MKNLRWVAAVAWMVIAAAIATVSLWGLSIASPSVVVNRQGFVEFGIAGGALTLCLLFACSGPWKLAAIPAGLFCCWCTTVGWQAESPRFELGQGGPWFGRVPLELIGFVALVVVASAIILSLRSGKPKSDRL